MFTGSLKRWKEDKRFLSPVFSRAMSLFLMNREFYTKKPGHYQLEGEDIYVNVEEGDTKPASDARFEVHARYVDIQIVLSGRERMDCCTEPLSGAPQEDRLKEKDIAFYPAPEAVQSLYLEAEDYAVFLPGELHAPNLAFEKPEFHAKAVIKIRADLV